MTPRSTDAPNLTTYEASRLSLTGSGQDAPVRHHVVSRSYLDSRSIRHQAWCNSLTSDIAFDFVHGHADLGHHSLTAPRLLPNVISNLRRLRQLSLHLRSTVL
jgi:hypothetical protein